MSACGAVSQMNPRGFIALSCCNLLSVDELGGLASSKPRLLEGRGWADGRWKKGRANELKRERASERAAIRDCRTPHGSPVC